MTGRSLGAAFRHARAGLGLATALVAVAAGATPAVAGFLLLKIDGSAIKWGTPVLSTAAEITYAVADQTMIYPDARNCQRVEPVDGVLETAGLSAADFDRELAAAFAVWEEVAALTFVPAADAGTADIVIGTQADVVRWSWALADVAADKTADVPVRQMRRGLICLNPERPWGKVADFGNVMWSGTSGLRHVLAHEIGHTLGLDHPGPTGALMSYRFEGQSAGLQPGDIAGIVTLYGMRQSPAVATADATGGATAGPAAVR